MANILRQNKKIVLLQFLFGSQDSIAGPETQNHVNEKIETLQNQVNSLQDRIRHLENTLLENSKYGKTCLSSRTLKASDATKILQQGNSTLKPNKGVYLLEDNPNLQQVEESISKGVSEAYKSPLKTAERSEES